MNITVKRFWNVPDTAQYRATTTGVLYMDGIQTCFTLEPTALMIPVGVYPVRLQFSPRFQRETPWLTVPERIAIEIHGVNFATDTEGCIGVGEHRLSDYEIDDTLTATTAIEGALRAAEAAGEASTVTIEDQ